MVLGEKGKTISIWLAMERGQRRRTCQMWREGGCGGVKYWGQKSCWTDWWPWCEEKLRVPGLDGMMAQTRGAEGRLIRVMKIG